MFAKKSFLREFGSNFSDDLLGEGHSLLLISIRVTCRIPDTRLQGFASKVRSSSLVRSVPLVLLRVTSWIVLVSRTNRNDPRNHTNYTKLTSTFNLLLRQSPPASYHGPKTRTPLLLGQPNPFAKIPREHAVDVANNLWPGDGVPCL